MKCEKHKVDKVDIQQKIAEAAKKKWPGVLEFLEKEGIKPKLNRTGDCQICGSVGKSVMLGQTVHFLCEQCQENMLSS